MLIEVKVNATFYTSKAKEEIRTLQQTFKGYDHTKEGAMTSINKQIARYSDNPLMIKVERTNIKMIENPFAQKGFDPGAASADKSIVRK